MSKTILFVYGTLKRGQRNHHWLRGQHFVGIGVTEPRFRVYDLGSYPGLVRDEQDGVEVRGELWEVDDVRLGELDHFEGVPDLFQRESIQVTGGSVVEAYLWNRPLPKDQPFGAEWPF